MIPRIAAKRSNNPQGLVAYLADTRQPKDASKHHNVHADPRIIGGNLGYEGPLDRDAQAQVIGDLRAVSKAHPGTVIKDGAIWHASLAIHADEGGLPDAQWSKIADDFMVGMGFTDETKADLRWVAVNHGPSAGGNHHIHIVANLIREDGTKASTWNDWPRSHRVCRELEAKYGLRQLADDGGPERGYTLADADASRRRGQNEPARVALERQVRAAAFGSTDEGDFIKRMRGAGLLARPNVQNGKVVGYAVSLANPDGTKVWFGGGSLARDLTLPRLRQQWPPNVAGYLDTWRGKAMVDPLQLNPSALEDTKAAIELTRLSTQIKAGLTPAEHVKISGELAGALAAASVANEEIPGPLAKASREASRGSATRTYTPGRKRVDLTGLTMLAVAASRPSSTAAHAILLRQLLNTFDALMEYRRALGAAGARRGRLMSPESDGIEDGVHDVAQVGIIMAARAVEAHFNGRIREIPRADVGRDAERPPEIPEKEWAGMDGDQREQVSLEPAWRTKTPTDAQRSKLIKDAERAGVTLDSDYRNWSRGQYSDAIDTLRKGGLQPGSVLTLRRTPEEHRDRMVAGFAMLNPRERATANRPTTVRETDKGPSSGR